jgi:hypothetical protein
MRERPSTRGLGAARLTEHAAAAMRRRQIAVSELRAMLMDPGQRLLVRPGRGVCQARLEWRFRLVLLRAVVDVDVHPPRVVTVYRTSRIARHWR